MNRSRFKYLVIQSIAKQPNVFIREQIATTTPRNDDGSDLQGACHHGYCYTLLGSVGGVMS